MSIKSLCGIWKVNRYGSDYLPGISSLDNVPLICYLINSNNNSNIKTNNEIIKIEMKKIDDKEMIDICIKYSSQLKTKNLNYQLGTLNIEIDVISNATIMSIIQNCNENFTEFSIRRMGPVPGQSSYETYVLNPITDEIKVTIEITLDSKYGAHFKLIQYLTRIFEPPYELPKFIHCKYSYGWKILNNWSPLLLSQCSCIIIESLSIKNYDSIKHEETKIINTIWTSPEKRDFQNMKLNLSTIPYSSSSSSSSDGEEFIGFVIQMTFQDISWLVVHRYRDFEALKNFIIQQNPYIESIKDLEKKFPKKTVGLIYRQSLLIQRIKKLNNFLKLLFRQVLVYNQLSVDVVLAFLMIPDNFAANNIKSEMINLNTIDHLSYNFDEVCSVTTTNLSTKFTESISNSPYESLYPQTLSPCINNHNSNCNYNSDKYINNYNNHDNSNYNSSNNNNSNNNTNNNSNNNTNDTIILHEKDFKQEAIKQLRSGSDCSSIVTDDMKLNQNNTINSNNNDKLYNIFGIDGLIVIKHGRRGKPKYRTLHYQRTEKYIYWGSAFTQRVYIDDILSVRKGSDVDPDVFSNKNETNSHMNNSNSTQTTQITPLKGTENLRRSANESDFDLCISIILPIRTFDIQFMNEKDCNTVYEAIQNILLSSFTIQSPYTKSPIFCIPVQIKKK